MMFDEQYVDFDKDYPYEPIYMIPVLDDFYSDYEDEESEEE